MKTVADVVALLREAKPDLERRFGVRHLGVFGSYARGEQRPDSDVDILVDVDSTIGLRFVDLAEHVEAVLGLPSEVVSRRALRAAAWSQIRDELVDVA